MSVLSYNSGLIARVAKLVDATGLGPVGGNTVEVQVLSLAPEILPNFTAKLLFRHTLSGVFFFDLSKKIQYKNLSLMFYLSSYRMNIVRIL